MTPRRPSLALVVSLLALVMASAGAGYAAGALPRNSVGTAQLKARSVTVAKLAPATIKKLSGKPGPVGKTGRTGATGAQGPTGPAGRSALDVLRKGETITGAWGVAVNGSGLTGVTLPVPTTQFLDDEHVIFAAGSDPVTGHDCDGSVAVPTSPAGYVCIYGVTPVGPPFSTGYGYGARHNFMLGTQPADTGTQSGFEIYLTSSVSGTATFNGVWSYTAP